MASALREAVERQRRLRGFTPRTHESYIHAPEEADRLIHAPDNLKHRALLATTFRTPYLDILIGGRASPRAGAVGGTYVAHGVSDGLPMASPCTIHGPGSRGRSPSQNGVALASWR